MSRQVVIQVDAFTDRPFAGNPAAVCLLDAPMDEARMRLIAREMNLSETAFVRRREDGAWDLRWFTPTVEVELCGHATLASAHALWREHGVADPELVFQSRSGPLRARQAGTDIQLDFPAVRVRAETPPDGLLQALGGTAQSTHRNRMDWLVELASADEVRNLSPDIHWLGRLEARGVIVTAPSDDPQYDFVSRFFGPGSGVAEDPVTGSAHCALAPFWAERLGRSQLTGYQASERGGTVGTEVRGDRVMLRGSAVTVMRGELLA